MAMVIGLAWAIGRCMIHALYRHEGRGQLEVGARHGARAKARGLEIASKANFMGIVELKTASALNSGQFRL